MVLQEVIDEYKFVYETLSKCEDYFSNADTLIENYFQRFLQLLQLFLVVVLMIIREIF